MLTFFVLGSSLVCFCTFKVSLRVIITQVRYSVHHLLHHSRELVLHQSPPGLPGLATVLESHIVAYRAFHVGSEEIPR